MEDATVEAVPAMNNDEWKSALDKVVPCCVVLKVTQTRAFDTEAAGSSCATGFVVDKQLGIILTNRHVVTPGPIVAEAMFSNREEVDVSPIYRDPIHDFGFLRFDPKRLRFMTVGEVPLAPEGACVGLEIRVVGNDSNEKLSILAGTLARLDRDAPQYGSKGYNDFNTFYFQAASGTKGGSSGSPVIDCHGRAVGLNAGGRTKAASAYYLPLERIVRALRIVQAAAVGIAPGGLWPAPAIPRGDLQTTFLFKGFDEVRRLGLLPQTEEEVRSAPHVSHGVPGASGGSHCVGMLVVDRVVPGSPAFGTLEAGDILVKVNGEVVTHFLPLEAALDNAVGGSVTLTVERGGAIREAVLPVTDLHAVTPACFLDMCGGSVHALSYQQARNNRTAVGQVYVAEPGYVLGKANIPKHAIVTSLAGNPTPDLDAFRAAMRRLAHGVRVPIEYLTFSERHRTKTSLLQVDQQWYGPPKLWTRDDSAGAWHMAIDHPEEAATAPAAVKGGDAGAAAVAPEPAAPAAAGDSPADLLMQPMEEDEAPAAVADTAAARADRALEEAVKASMVLVEVHIPLVALSDGVHSRSFGGNGVVVHHGAHVGLVLVDRNTLAVGPCDVNLSFGAYPCEIPAKVRFLHPLHNFAIASYEVKDLPAAAVGKIRAASLLAEPLLQRGDVVRLVGLTKHLRIMQRRSTVTNATAALSIAAAEVPRFRAVHEEVIKLDQDFGTSFSGMLVDDAGRMRALWGSYAEQADREEREWCAGLPTAVFEPWVRQLLPLDERQTVAPLPVRVLDAELEALMLSKAAQLGLPAAWVSRLDRLDQERRQVLRVRSCVANSHAAQVLKGGDMVLAISGRPVTCFRDVEDLIMRQPSGSATASASASASASRSGSNAATEVHCDAVQAYASPPKRQKVDPAVTGGADGPAGDANGHSKAAADANGQPGAVAEPPEMQLTIFRSGKVQSVAVRLGCEDGMGTRRIVHWCGAQLQAPHRGVRELGYLPPSAGVFISRWHHGSPSHRYGLFGLHWISEVNGVATPDLDALLAVVAPLRDGDDARVKMVHLETGAPKVITLKLDLKYWPTWSLTFCDQTYAWQRTTISSV